MFWDMMVYSYAQCCYWDIMLISCQILQLLGLRDFIDTVMVIGIMEYTVFNGYLGLIIVFNLLNWINGARYSGTMVMPVTVMW